MAKHVTLENGSFYGITTDMQGKMKKMWSLNTSSNVNPFCQRMRQVPGSICSHCYSKRTEARYSLAHTLWENNFNVLTTQRLTKDEIPHISKDIFRFSAHGELGSRIHYENLIAIADANPDTTFTIWTKNLSVINEGGILKRDNVIHIYSTPRVDEPNVFLPDGFDKVFTVYTKEYAEEHNIKINCGGRACNTCRKCYNTKNHTVYINELVK